MRGFGVNSSSFVVDGDATLGAGGDAEAFRCDDDHSPRHWQSKHTSVRLPKL